MQEKNTNIDDYYSQIPSQQQEDTWEKKVAIKLKIKAKIQEADEKPVILDEPAEEEKVVVKEEEKKEIKFKKQPSIITFEERKIIPKEEPKKEEPAVVEEIKAAEEEIPAKIEAKLEIKAEEATPSVSIDSESLERFSNNKKRSFFDKKPETAQAKTETAQAKPSFPQERKEFFGWFDSNKKFKSKKTFKIRWALDEDDGTFRRAKKTLWMERKEKSLEEMKQILADKTGQEVALPDFLTVKEFSEKIWIPFSKIMSEFLKNGMMATLNTRVDFDTCFIISEVFNIKVVKEQNDEVSITSVIDWNLTDMLKNDDATKQVTRAPIISIMGHVDHGKTSILDYIRKTSVASWEAWGITQKIWAYQVVRDWKKITFLDTPWHEAFSIMRARWAKLTDIAIIVVAADEWMKPQTIESINHAKEAWVPVIVAVNKMDKVWANLDFVKGQLAEQWLQPEDWGWNTVVVPVSAHTWLGIDTLLEMILLVSEMQELKADPTRPAIATVIESHLDSRLGPLATVLVNSWTLRKWDCVVCAASAGRLKFLKDYKWKNIDEAGPSTPVLISWLSKVVEGWDILQVTPDIETAKNKAHEFELVRSSKSLNHFEWASLELLLNRIKTWNLKQLKLVVKAESNWSLEALKDALHKQWTAEIKTQIIHSWVGDINDSDVLMAGTSQAILVGYNVWIVSNAKHTLVNSKIEVINKKVIYHILEKIESIITWMIDIKHDDVDLWEAKVKAIFFSWKDRMVIGCEIKEWRVENRSKVRVIRDSKKVWSGDIISLKQWVIDVQEILEGEFGIAFKWDVSVEVWDILEFYKVVQRK